VGKLKLPTKEFLINFSTGYHRMANSFNFRVLKKRMAKRRRKLQMEVPAPNAVPGRHQFYTRHCRHVSNSATSGPLAGGPRAAGKNRKPKKKKEVRGRQPPFQPPIGGIHYGLKSVRVLPHQAPKRNNHSRPIGVNFSCIFTADLNISASLSLPHFR